MPKLVVLAIKTGSIGNRLINIFVFIYKIFVDCLFSLSVCLVSVGPCSVVVVVVVVVYDVDVSGRRGSS